MAGAFGRSLESYKANFFDIKRILRLAEDAEERVLSRFGAFVRTRARSSLRRRKKASPPGMPPSTHAGKDDYASLKSILFAYEPFRRAVVIGPVLLNGSRRSPTVPELHEFGGTSTRVDVQLSGGKWVPKSYGKRWGENRPHRTRLVRYPARPYMRPAFRAELGGKLREQLRGMLARAA